MDSLRKLLYPFSLIFDGVTQTRNTLYDKGVLTTHEFEIPLIVVGNLRVGGTGKTPMIDYLVRLLKTKYKVAVLSRGYKRQTSGFVLADNQTDALRIGDEPFQIFRQHAEILVAVDEDRAHGIQNLLNIPQPPQVILLDDAYQHRSVKAELNILLTPFNDLYVDDQVLPSGNLRENATGADRAQIIVVTKCPTNLSENDSYDVLKKLKPGLTQTVFFSSIAYHDKIIGNHNEIALTDLKDYQVLLLTGIADPKPLTDFLNEQNINFEHLQYPDHYNFKTTDIELIKTKFEHINTKNKLILTTEKDFVRIFALFDNLYYLPISTYFVNYQNDFNQMIFKYVEQSSGNR